MCIGNRDMPSRPRRRISKEQLTNESVSDDLMVTAMAPMVIATASAAVMAVAMAATVVVVAIA